MKHFDGNVNIGLRDKYSNRLVAVYPHPVNDSNDIEKKVFDWYYAQSCTAEEEMRNCFVDVLTENEVKSLKL